MTPDHTTLDVTVASTPDTDDLTTVPPVPFDLRTDEFDVPSSSLRISGDAAAAILTEVWRISRNPHILELEQETRGHIVPDLQLSTVAVEHSTDGVLDATAAACAFIDTVRSEYPHQLVDGPTSTWADTAAPSGLRTLTFK